MAKALLASEFSVRPGFGPHPVDSQGKGPWPVVADPSPTSLFPSRVGGRLGVRTGSWGQARQLAGAGAPCALLPVLSFQFSRFLTVSLTLPATPSTCISVAPWPSLVHLLLPLHLRPSVCMSPSISVSSPSPSLCHFFPCTPPPLCLSSHQAHIYLFCHHF